MGANSNVVSVHYFQNYSPIPFSIYAKGYTGEPVQQMCRSGDYVVTVVSSDAPLTGRPIHGLAPECYIISKQEDQGTIAYNVEGTYFCAG